MFMMFDKTGWFNEILRVFFGEIDHLVFSLLSWVMTGVFAISDLMVNAALVEFVYNRIYIILSLFMVFKLSFSFLKYLVSPDAMSDKEQGVGKLIMKTVVMLCILVALPILFFEPLVKIETASGTEERTVLSALQTGVIKTLPSLILGYEGASVQGSAGAYGEDMALSILRSLYYPMECETNPNDPSCDSVTGDNNVNSFQAFKDSLVQDYDGDGTYDYYYMWPLTTVAGILLVVIMLGIAIDVAIRTFKLIILQMIAPIPVMTYIDPKSSKDGAFNSWIKNFISTYIDIFIKLGIVYLVILLVSQLLKSGGLFESGHDLTSITDGKTRLFVRVFLIIGLFKFAKDAPKFIKDAMGIKDNGSGGGFMGKALSGMAGAAAGFAGGLATGGIAGGMSGILSGASAGVAGNAGKAFSQVRDEQAKLLGKTPGGMKGKLQNKAMQRSVMKHTGLDLDKLSGMKKDMINKQNEANKKLYQYQHDPKSISYEEVQEAQAIAAKAQSEYESANGLAKQIGLKPGFMEEKRKHGSVYVAATRAKTVVKEEAGNVVADIKSKTTDRVSKWATQAKSDVIQAYDNNKFNSDAEEYGFEKASEIHTARLEKMEAKEDYKRSLRGGIDNTIKPEDAREKFKKADLKYDETKKG